MPQIVAFSGDLLNRQTNLNKRRHSLIASTTDEIKNSFDDVDTSDGQKYHSSACFETGNFQVKIRPFLNSQIWKDNFLTRLAVTHLGVKVQLFKCYWVRVQLDITVCFIQMSRYPTKLCNNYPRCHEFNVKLFLHSADPSSVKVSFNRFRSHKKRTLQQSFES